MPNFLTPNQRFEESSKEVQQIVLRVLALEKEKLSQKAPHIKSDIQAIIKEIIIQDED